MICFVLYLDSVPVGCTFLGDRSEVEIYITCLNRCNLLCFCRLEAGLALVRFFENCVGLHLAIFVRQPLE